jgi:DNA-binding transcriptional LysR family regulator
MDLSDLQIFRTVVEAGGVTRAAAQLNRVQSNVTTRVRQLEDELGVPLFLREGKRLHLSPAGSVLLGYAQRLLDLAREARDALHDTTPRGPFRVGSMESTAAVRLPGPLSEYHRRYAEVTLELRTGNTRELAAQVLAGEIDVALMAEPVDARLEKSPVFLEELVIVAESGHPPIRSAADVSHRSLLAFEAGCAYRKRLEDWFGRDGLLPDRIVELSSYHAILGCAVAGMGIALLPRSVVETHVDRASISIHRLPRDEGKVWTVMAWRKGAQSPKISALAEILLGKRLPRSSKEQRPAGKR